MATKQDFQACADMIKAELMSARTIIADVGSSPSMIESARAVLHVVSRMGRNWAALYARENGRFDRARFYAACGLSSDGHAD